MLNEQIETIDEVKTKTCQFAFSDECIGTGCVDMFIKHRRMCKQCHIVKHKNYYNQNKDKIIANAKIYHRDNARKIIDQKMVKYWHNKQLVLDKTEQRASVETINKKQNQSSTETVLNAPK
jgi:hypothetical protein